MLEYGTEDQCGEALARARWPHGFECPYCAHTHVSEFRPDGRRYWQCGACHYQVSLTVGTVMEHGRLALTKWFPVIYLMTQSKTNIAALALMRQLGVSWKTAWLLKHKLMEVLYQREAEQLLIGYIRVDGAYLCGERTGGKAGRGPENKVAFVATVEMWDNRLQCVRFDPVAGFSFSALTPWAHHVIAPGSCVLSDGLLGFEVLEKLGIEHKIVLPPKRKIGIEIEPFKWLNALLGNLKTALSGTHHSFKFAKYAHRYLAEVQYRFNRRLDLAAMVSRLGVAVMHTAPCSKQSLLDVAALST